MITIENLTFAYNTEEFKENAINGVSLNIKKGEFVAVLGHNGSGKSTLAKHINAVLLPSGGRVYVCGMDTKETDNLWKIRSKAAMVFQNPDNQIVATIVEDDVAFAAENLGIEPKEIKKRVEYALGAVDMLKYKNHAPHLLSGGQKQRVAIAGVIAMKPDIIVFDEPTAMLDPVGRYEVMKTIKTLNSDYGITVVLITHNMDEAVMAKRVVIMDKGTVLKDSTPDKIFSDVEMIRKIGLDVPQSAHLAYLLKKDGYDIKENVLDADQCVKELIRLCL